jgi:hypothetical protein
MTAQTRISPQFESSDWATLRPRLDDPADTSAWTRAINIIFHDRIQSRLLEPTNRLSNATDSADLGFGFAMLALDCLLIDTIQSFREGRLKGSEARTAKAFVDFFRASARLSVEFQSRRVIDEFYDAIRCGLMHDGETRKGWRIKRRHATSVVERVSDGHLLYRDNFHDAVRAEFEVYKSALLNGQTTALRRNFLLRMDAICGLQIAPQLLINYFEYGSNMDQEQMRAPAPSAVFGSVACLEGFRLVFNKRGANGSAKANIVRSSDAGAVVHGCLYEIPEFEFDSLKDIETGYTAVSIEVDQNGAKIRAQAFFADADALVTGTPSETYLSRILRGAEHLGLARDYVDSLRHVAATQ